MTMRLALLALLFARCAAFAPPASRLPRRPACSSSRLPVSAALPPASLWIGGAVVGGVAGTPFVVRATTSWYRAIPKPTWCPPDRIFAPVWTTLYASMGYAASRVAAAAGARSRPIELALAHYALNIAWAPIFFGLKYFKTALVVQVLLVASLVEIMRQFLAVSGVLSAALLAPYLLWLVFATALNFELCRLNPNPRASIAGSPAS